MSNFTCPQCGCREWGSVYNFDGFGDLGGWSTTFGGTWTRMCHGYVEEADGCQRQCGYRWNSRDDEKHGIPKPQGGVVTGRMP